MIKSSAHNKYFCRQSLLRNIVKLTIGLGLIYSVYVWTNQSGSAVKGNNLHHHSDHTLPTQWIKGFKNDEYRIAQQFAVDTLPELMRLGLIKKYERHRRGTTVFVTGKVWKERSRFFKESLLLATMVYNKVNGYSLETRIVDHCSQQLYAHAVSAERKEFFD